jgi:hypothetical protein
MGEKIAQKSTQNPSPFSSTKGKNKSRPLIADGFCA